MGLEGTLRVFSLNDIFQVLGLQRKSGVLTVEGPEDTVTISFLGGQVVSAESASKRLENRVGSLLIKSGRINREQLARALQLQSETQQRLGFLLIRERLVSPEDLRTTLRLQIFRIVFPCFRWTDGRFRFTQEGAIEYDADHMSPVPTESILMEAAQMLDEWPRLEKKIRSREVVLRRAPGVEGLRLLSGGEESGEGTLAVSRSEAEVWRWINGERSVGDILEQAFLSDFEVYKGLSDLLDRNLIAETKISSPREIPESAGPTAVRFSLWSVLVWLFLVAVVLLAVRLTPRKIWSVPLGVSEVSRQTETLLKAGSLRRLVVLERAIRVFYDSSGQYPRSLEDLVVAGILPNDALEDPYGRRYRYILASDDEKFHLYGFNALGTIDLDLSFDRSLAPVAEIRPVSRSRTPEKVPGVQVIE